LRRQALGIIRIIVEKKYPLSLRELIEESEKQLKEKMERTVEEVRNDVLDFFRIRYQNFLLDRKVPFDVTEAVLTVSFDELPDVQGRIDALQKAREWEDFESIVIASKRAMNILKGSPPKGKITPSLFTESVEQNLHQSFLKAKNRIDSLLKKRDYPAALLEMTRMKKPIDEFFDGVMVMVEDEEIRNNRRALLDEIGKLFLRIADFSKLT
jgi:glycyl-tRNA synthetase beta chain